MIDLDREYAADAGAHEVLRRLFPAFGAEADERDTTIAAQRRTIERWIATNATIAAARKTYRQESDLQHQIQGAETPAEKGKISRKVKAETLDAYGLPGLPSKGARDLVTGAQGTGKSRVTAEAIAKVEHPIIIRWLVPTIDKAIEQAREYQSLAGPDSMPAYIVRGRQARDPNADNEMMCPRAHTVNRAAAYEVNVETAICRVCPLRDVCGYQAQRARLEEAERGVFFMAMEYLWLPAPMPKADMVVVDESCVDGASDSVGFSPSRITEDDKWSDHHDLTGAMERRRVATIVRTALVEHQGSALAFLRGQGVTRAQLKDGASHLAGREEAKVEVDGRMDDEKINAILNAVELSDIRKVYKLFKQLQVEIDQPRRVLNSVWFEPNAKVKIDGVYELQDRVFVAHVRHPRLAEQTPVLVLDGTGSIEIYRSIFGERMDHHRFAVPRDAQVIQVNPKTFSRQSITGLGANDQPVHAKGTTEAAKLRHQVVELVSMLPGQTLLVTYKQAEAMLVDEVPEHVHVAHFGNIRGLNEYENCDNVVVMGRQQPSPFEIETMTRPFAADDPEPLMLTGEYVPQTRGRRMVNGEDNAVEVQVHPDPRCQAQLEQIREAEIVQAVDRVRPVFNHRNIILLTSIPVDITVNRTLPWTRLRPSRFAKAFHRYGVLPGTPKDLHHAFPDLWLSVKTADVELCRAGGFNTLKSQIRLYLGSEGNEDAQGSVVSACYRKKGQKGAREARALVRSDLSDPRTELARLVGELAEFRVIPNERSKR